MTTTDIVVDIDKNAGVGLNCCLVIGARSLLGVIIHEWVWDTYSYSYLGKTHVNKIILFYVIMTFYGSLRYLIYKDKTIELFLVIGLSRINYNLMYRYKIILNALTWLLHPINKNKYVLNLSLNFNRGISKMKKYQVEDVPTKKSFASIMKILRPNPSSQFLHLFPSLETLKMKKYQMEDVPTEKSLTSIMKILRPNPSSRFLYIFPSLETLKIYKEYYITMSINIIHSIIMIILVDRYNSRSPISFVGISLLGLTLAFHTYAIICGARLIRKIVNNISRFKSTDILELQDGNKLYLRNDSILGTVNIAISLVIHIFIISFHLLMASTWLTRILVQ